MVDLIQPIILPPRGMGPSFKYAKNNRLSHASNCPVILARECDHTIKRDHNKR